MYIVYLFKRRNMFHCVFIYNDFIPKFNAFDFLPLWLREISDMSVPALFFLFD